MRSESAKVLYDAFLKRMGELYSPSKIKDGEFGAMMQVGLTNDGPVTFILDSDEKKEKKEKKETTAQV
ncbi:hypothetical protein L7F22_015972 [Adiantum nelumboides]|nr:hypothetical protein [Adiantum nelumboides]